MAHTQTHHTPLTPLQITCDAQGIWTGSYKGIFISVADTREAVVNDINAFLGK